MKIYKYLLSIAFIAVLNFVAFAHVKKDSAKTNSNNVQQEKFKKENKPSVNNNKKKEKESENKEPLPVKISDTLKLAINFVLCRLSNNYTPGQEGFCRDSSCQLNDNHKGIYVKNYNEKVITCIKKSNLVGNLTSNEEKANYLTSVLFNEPDIDSELKALGNDKSKLMDIKIALLALLNPHITTPTQSEDLTTVNYDKSTENQVEQESNSWIL